MHPKNLVFQMLCILCLSRSTGPIRTGKTTLRPRMKSKAEMQRQEIPRGEKSASM
jgi:hypothetical protein